MSDVDFLELFEAPAVEAHGPVLIAFRVVRFDPVPAAEPGARPGGPVLDPLDSGEMMEGIAGADRPAPVRHLAETGLVARK